MNSRDTTMAQLTDVNLHRIIRRIPTYGAPYDRGATSEHDDDIPRGIHFILIGAKAMATMEFLQQEWINNGNFMDLGKERDPSIGLQEGGGGRARNDRREPHSRAPDTTTTADSPRSCHPHRESRPA